jgi:transposase
MAVRYTSQNLDHLGLVAAMFDELGLGEALDEQIPQDREQRKISVGQAVKAMVLNGLGFVNQRLYLVPRFFENKPTERLIGPGVKPEHLNDDTLGRALDALYAQDVTALYAQLSAQAARRLGLTGRVGHLDSTSFHVDGDYHSAEPPEVQVIHITPGYSRDHRPDLNQVVLALMTEHQAGLPLWMKPLSGNREDKAELKQVVEAHLDQMRQAAAIDYLIADSALYTAATLQSLGSQKWITRVPATVKEAQAVIQNASTQTLTPLDERYRYQVLDSSYAGVAQRWLLVESAAARERALPTVNRQVLKASAQEARAFQALCRQRFACRPDAEQALQRLQATLKLTTLEQVSFEEVPYYKRRGRPGAGQPPAGVHVRVSGAIATALAPRQALLEQKSRFILATNELDAQALPPAEWLAAYKGQSGVERGFRFLKDPLFLASSLFLKSPQRIMALLMVMTLCLLVYSALEYRMRQALSRHQQTVPDQKGKPTATPIARWIFPCFVGIHVLLVNETEQFVLNLQNIHQRLLALLGPPYEAVYS